MNKREKAKIILEKLDEVIQIDWNREGEFIRAITKALGTIERLTNDKEKELPGDQTI